MFCSTTAWAAPHIGYLYPAGAKQGTTFKITVGGQELRGANKVYISGEGVTASVIQSARQPNNIQKEQREYITKRLKEVKAKRLSEASGAGRDAVINKRTVKKKGKTDKKDETENQVAMMRIERISKLPLLYDLDNKSLRELEHIKNIVFTPRMFKQLNSQLADQLLVEVTVAPDTVPGSYEFRVGTKNGLSNPVVFQVGTFAETSELEPNGQDHNLEGRIKKTSTKPKPNPIKIPVVVNGQIMPGDVDRFQFDAKQGQKLVIDAQARSLIPYLADAVPGWFQATLTLYDQNGKEVAFTDDYRFNPDPVLFYQIPKDGKYELEIRDSIYRGREDFVYRISIGQSPFITGMFPLGSSQGTKTVAFIEGWNLADKSLTLDTKSAGKTIRKINWHKDDRFSNFVPYAVNSLPECTEITSNNTIKTAQKVSLPTIVNGRIDSDEDVDVFKFDGKAGGKIVAEVYARKLNSPLDSLLRLTDASGKVIIFNDDHVQKASHLHKDVVGSVTHHADSYLSADLPKNGPYYLHISDTTSHGGSSYGYRLRISRPMPDFDLRITPSSLFMRKGGTVPITVHALRKDGFNGEIQVVLKNDLAGFKIDGGIIPAGTGSITMTLTAPRKLSDRTLALQFEGKARVGEKTIVNSAIPADDTMQAFLYRHLMTAQELIVAIKKEKWPANKITLANKTPMKISKGKDVKIRSKIQIKKDILKELQVQLQKPVDGFAIDDVTVMPDGLEFMLKVDKKLEPGFKDNLIVEVLREFMPKAKKDSKKPPKKIRYSVGFFPAIPFQITKN